MLKQLDVLNTKKNFDLNLTSYTNLNSKLYKCKTIKLLEENTAEDLHDLELHTEFSYLTPKSQSIQENID